MNDYLLLTSQKNDTFTCIEEAGFNPGIFYWAEKETRYSILADYHISVLRLSRSDFYFEFDRTDLGQYFCRFRPGYDRSFEVTAAKSRWNDVLDDFRRWLSCLKRESVRDAWEQLKDYVPHETFVGTAEMSNAPFSSFETENIVESLDKLQAQIEKSLNLQGDQLAFVKRQFEYLKEGAKRQGRKDWVHTSIGVIVGIAVNLALSPEKAKLLWDLVKSCFAKLLPLPAP